MRTGRRRARRDSRCAHVAPHVTSGATCDTALRDVRSVGSEGGKPKGGWSRFEADVSIAMEKFALSRSGAVPARVRMRNAPG